MFKSSLRHTELMSKLDLILDKLKEIEFNKTDIQIDLVGLKETIKEAINESSCK